MSRTTHSRDAGVVMPVSELHGRTVWNEAGERIGVVRNVNVDEDGRITSLDVRDRWILGPSHEVPAGGMRFEEGDVIVPATTSRRARSEHGEQVHDRDHVVADHEAVAKRASSPSPVLLSGTHGARRRFGGLDLVGSFLGALATVGSLLLLGGLLGAAFGAEPTVIDTSTGSLEELGTLALVVGAVTLFLSCLLGGWTAGRASRYDGARNGMAMAVWVLAFVALFAALGTWLGDQYNVLAGVDLPSFSTEEFALWGSLALAATVLLMLLGGALGGMVGARWHRRADRAMLDVVDVDGIHDNGDSDLRPLERPIVGDRRRVEANEADDMARSTHDTAVPASSATVEDVRTERVRVEDDAFDADRRDDGSRSQERRPR